MQRRGDGCESESESHGKRDEGMRDTLRIECDALLGEQEEGWIMYRDCPYYSKKARDDVRNE
jgi:hypothetical protein